MRVWDVMEQLDIQQIATDTARETFKLSYLRPHQLLIVSDILENAGKRGKPNLLASLPTGAGKSLCFMIPAVLLDGVTVIVYPLLSLMRDQEARFAKAGVRSFTLRGGMSPDEKNAIWAALRSKDAKILVTNVEMLTQKRVRDQLKGLRLSLLVLDEAHTCISWGDSFRPAYRELGQIARDLAPERILAFTATSDSETTDRLKRDILGEDARIVFASPDRPNITYHAVRPLFPTLEAASILAPTERRPAIIFCRSREMTVKVANNLRSKFRTYAYHAGLDKDERKRIEDAFMNDSEAVMAATTAYGMGVDKRNVRTVIHWGLPDTAADYLQESGRAGRDTRPSEAWAFLGLGWKESPIEWMFTGNGCIRGNLCHAMGLGTDGDCAGCDECDSTHKTPEGVPDLQKILRVPYLTKTSSAQRKLMRRKKFKWLPSSELSRGMRALVAEGWAKERFGRLRFTGRKEDTKRTAAECKT